MSREMSYGIVIQELCHICMKSIPELRSMVDNQLPPIRATGSDLPPLKTKDDSESLHSKRSLFLPYLLPNYNEWQSGRRPDPISVEGSHHGRGEEEEWRVHRHILDGEEGVPIDRLR